MGSGKQWSVDTVRQVKTLMSIGLPLPCIAAQTGVVLQTLRSFSARVKKGYTRDKHSNHRGAPVKQTDEMKRVSRRSTLSSRGLVFIFRGQRSGASCAASIEL